MIRRSDLECFTGVAAKHLPPRLFPVIACGLRVEYPHVPWTVDVRGPLECQPAFDGIADACQQLLLSIAIRDDGTVGYVYAYGGRHLPALTLDPHPTLSAEAASQNLVGVHLTRVRGPFEEGRGELVAYGAIERADIGNSGLRIKTNPDDGKWTFSLVHEVDVQHGAGHGTFALDACTGAIVGRAAGGP
jgi:hypothetical protein